MARVALPPTVLHELDGPDTCDMCGTPGLKTELVRDPFIYGAGDDGVELVVEIPVHTCSSCGPYTDDQAEDIRHDEVCRHLGVLGGDRGSVLDGLGEQPVRACEPSGEPGR